MSIRALALELYGAQQRVDGLERALLSGGDVDCCELRHDLDIARRELQTLRRILDGEKESGEFRRRF